MPKTDPEKEKKQRKEFLKQAADTLLETKKQLLKEMQAASKRKPKASKTKGETHTIWQATRGIGKSTLFSMTVSGKNYTLSMKHCSGSKTRLTVSAKAARVKSS